MAVKIIIAMIKPKGTYSAMCKFDSKKECIGNCLLKDIYILSI
jgi:hypothetical protein